MKVLLVTNLYPPNAIGGYERLCASVASGLAARGHTLAVLTSDYGGLVADADDVAVERSLKLLVSPSSIYEPFIGSPAERAAINRHNLVRLTEAMARVQPEVVLAGNLFFLDPRFEAALGGHIRPRPQRKGKCISPPTTTGRAHSRGCASGHTCAGWVCRT